MRSIARLLAKYILGTGDIVAVFIGAGQKIAESSPSPSVFFPFFFFSLFTSPLIPAYAGIRGEEIILSK